MRFFKLFPIIVLACFAVVAMADNASFSKHIRCETQLANGTSLADLELLQGTTPLLLVDHYHLGRSVQAVSNVVCIFQMAPTSLSTYWVGVTNQTYSESSYSVQLPTVGTNTANRFWHYEVLFYSDGKKFWGGSGRVKIEATQSTAPDGLTWQTFTSVSVAELRSALDAEAQARAAGDLVAMTNWQAVVYSLTNGAALGATALQPSWAETGTVFRATEVIGAQSTLIETAWQNPANAADWTWTSNGREITLTGYSGPNAVVIPDMLDGLPVTGFGGVFNGNMDITSVGGGANIKAVGDYAFVICESLISVSLPACTTVGDYAFNHCWALNYVSLPACTTVGNSAFSGCGALNSVPLPACTTVDNDAFVLCGALISVSLPACTTVGTGAFAGCEALNSVTFGQNAPAPAANVFEYSTPTIYVSNPHATGWGDTWNGRPVVRAASMSDIASHNASGTAHADIRALIPTLPGPGCTELAYAPDGTNVIITGATYSYFFAPDKAYTLSVAPDAPRYHYSIEIIGDHACTLPAGHRLRGSWTITGTNEVVVAPSTGTVWNVFGRGL